MIKYYYIRSKPAVSKKPALATIAGKQEKPMDKGYCFNIESTASANEVLEMILDEIAGNSNIPNHVQKACRDWIES